MLKKHLNTQEINLKNIKQKKDKTLLVKKRPLHPRGRLKRKIENEIDSWSTGGFGSRPFWNSQHKHWCAYSQQQLWRKGNEPHNKNDNNKYYIELEDVTNTFTLHVNTDQIEKQELYQVTINMEKKKDIARSINQINKGWDCVIKKGWKIVS